MEVLHILLFLSIKYVGVFGSLYTTPLAIWYPKGRSYSPRGWGFHKCGRTVAEFRARARAEWVHIGVTKGPLYVLE